MARELDEQDILETVYNRLRNTSNLKLDNLQIDNGSRTLAQYVMMSHSLKGMNIKIVRFHNYFIDNYGNCILNSIEHECFNALDLHVYNHDFIYCFTKFSVWWKNVKRCGKLIHVDTPKIDVVIKV